MEDKNIDKSLPRQIYLITDGAVYNTQEIVSYIKNNRGSSVVHTFGIGYGVSTELIKECARAGGGNHEFISEPSEIENKVMLALQRNFFPYIQLKDFTFLTKSGEIPYDLKAALADGFRFDQQVILS